MKKEENSFIIPLLIATSAALLFIPFIGRMHLFDWDEINFAECAREMIVSKNFLSVQIDFKPFWEKPPLFIWLQVLSMKAFGINEFASRFPNAVCGIVSLVLISRLGKRLHSVKFGAWWAFIYTASILPQLYFHSGIIDPWFNLFIFTAVWFFSSYSDPFASSSRKWYYAMMSGFFIGLAVLTKGPTALLILGLLIGIFYLPFLFRMIFRKRQEVIVSVRFSDFLLFSLVAIVTGGFWFLLQVMDGHKDMVMKFILYQVRLFVIPDAGHGGHWSYHFWVLLAGVFPASLFAFKAFRINKNDPGFFRHFHRIMLILFWVVLILFSIVTTKIVHYSSLCYFPLTFLATRVVFGLIDGSMKWKKGFTALLLFLTGIISLVVIGLPIAMQYKQQIIDSGMIRDAFAVKNLQAEVHWSGLESLPGIFLLIGVLIALLIRKKNMKKALVLLFATSLIFTHLTILIFPYKIEKYSQRAAIEFFQEKSKENCYVLNAGYFSYAPLFYGNKLPGDVKRPMWLLTGNIDRPFYLVLKETEYEKWKQEIPAMKVLYKKNGFVFLKRIDAPIN
ncbi:MAG: glycosyltransferase family 39 protein [Bacteroidetes bacterium]|nr:glycosyltransferase family 39 protein [Bacteroidota bacterium]